MILFEGWNNPNTDTVRHFADAFDIVYHKEEIELKNVFEALLSSASIKKRVEKLNVSYHKGLKRTGRFNAIVENLQNYDGDLESRIKAGDLNAVEFIANNDSYNCFSFATKYCSFVNFKTYPIYDDRVRRVLNLFQKNRDTRFYHERFLKIDYVRVNVSLHSWIPKRQKLQYSYGV